MAHLTKPKQYDIKDTNIELLGSDLEKEVRTHAGDSEPAWDNAGKEPGLQIWRIEKFKVVEWPKERKGVFYDGDSYIVLNTYKASPDAETLSYDLHFWLGEHTSQDEAGTAAYKTVELDDHLGGAPIQYREIQGFESEEFLSYFPRFTILSGGVDTGFHHVTAPPPLDIRKLYRVILTKHTDGTEHGPAKTSLVVREVPAQASSLIEGDVYVLDKGNKVLQLNTTESAGQEKFKAAEFARSIVDARTGAGGGQTCELQVFDEGAGAGGFLLEFGEGTHLIKPKAKKPSASTQLFRLSDASGQLSFSKVTPVSQSSLSSKDVFILDDPRHRVVWVWVGSDASKDERRLGVVYAQRYLHKRRQEMLEQLKEGDDEDEAGGTIAEAIVKLNQGRESAAFFRAFGEEV
ncbi:fragmin60 [Flagelloscypha sp. PMI_526]|nr:fragmin60 [Flagelloscypha sp. PMI_526]